MRWFVCVCVCEWIFVIKKFAKNHNYVSTTFVFKPYSLSNFIFYWNIVDLQR